MQGTEQLTVRNNNVDLQLIQYMSDNKIYVLTASDIQRRDTAIVSEFLLSALNNSAKDVLTFLTSLIDKICESNSLKRPAPSADPDENEEAPLKFQKLDDNDRNELEADKCENQNEDTIPKNIEQNVEKDDLKTADNKSTSASIENVFINDELDNSRITLLTVMPGDESLVSRIIGKKGKNISDVCGTLS